MEGIETSGGTDNFGPSNVSRCPDMEGIETTVSAFNITVSALMSVGAPTWRGLKQGIGVRLDVRHACQ